VLQWRPLCVATRGRFCRVALASGWGGSAPGGNDVVGAQRRIILACCRPDVGAGLGLGHAEAGYVAQDLQRVDVIDAAVAVHITLERVTCGDGRATRLLGHGEDGHIAQVLLTGVSCRVRVGAAKV